jgi:hypothetical protein
MILFALPKDLVRDSIISFMCLKDIVHLDTATTEEPLQVLLKGFCSGCFTTTPINWVCEAECFEYLLKRNIYLDRLVLGNSVQTPHIEQYEVLTHVKVLNLLNWNGSCERLVTLLKYCTVLQDLSIGEITATVPVAHAITARSPTLRTLYLKAIGGIDAAFVQTLSLPTLRTLVVEFLIGADPTFFQRLGFISSNLQKLTIYVQLPTQFSFEGLEKLEEVDLSANRTIPDGVVISLAEHCLRLRALNVWSCGELTDRSIIAVANGCPLLERLEFYMCKRVSNQAIRALAAHSVHLRYIHWEPCSRVTQDEMCNLLKVSAQRGLNLVVE